MSEAQPLGAVLAGIAARHGITIKPEEAPPPAPDCDAQLSEPEQPPAPEPQPPEPSPDGEPPPLPEPSPEDKALAEKARRKRERARAFNESLASYWKSVDEPRQPFSYAGDEQDFDLDRTGRPCRTCRGTRWLKGPDGPMHCPSCSGPHQPEEQERLGRVAGLSAAQRSKTFDSFTVRRGTEAALAAAHDWVNTRQPPWLHIFGVQQRSGPPQQGIGKTHLALACANALLDQGIQVRFTYGAAIRDAWHRHREAGTLAEWQDWLTNPAPLIVDDLGAAQSSDFAIEQLEGLLNKRERDMLPTLVTSVADTEAIKRRLSVSIGRRLEDPSLCTSVAISCTQYRGGPDG